LTPELASGVLAGVELIVSVRTEVLHARPQVTIRSVFPAAAVKCLPSSDATDLLPQAVATGGIAIMEGPASGGCLLFRLPDALASFVEMVHPTDFRHDELRAPSATSGAFQLEHHLFPQSLEKGVILRSRLRGILVAREHDRRVAVDCFRAFAQS
jgi:hypothetical protein